MADLHIIIPMAGFSRRFTEAGYEKPKYMLEVEGRSLLELSLRSFAGQWSSAHFTIVCRHDYGTPAFVEGTAARLGLSSFSVEVLNGPTAGQAETVELGLADARHELLECPLLIFNIDTVRPYYALPEAILRQRPSGYLEVTRLPGDGWSFAEPDPAVHGRVVRTTEKVRISDLCSTGLYYFDRPSTFLDALASDRRNPSAKELYVAPLYNHVIAAGGSVLYDEIAPSDVIFSGVPAEYEALIQHPELVANI
jgi:NDP-sugar pyrophosphorylase family protein